MIKVIEVQRPNGDWHRSEMFSPKAGEFYRYAAALGRYIGHPGSQIIAVRIRKVSSISTMNTQHKIDTLLAIASNARIEVIRMQELMASLESVKEIELGVELLQLQNLLATTSFLADAIIQKLDEPA